MKRNLIEDTELLEGLRRLGFKFFDSPTYEDAVNWLREKKSIILTVYPEFGEKIGYDHFEIIGWTTEYMAIFGGGVYLGHEVFDKFKNSYRVTPKPGDTPINSIIYPTYLDALKEAVRNAWMYCVYHNSDHDWDGYRNKLEVSPPQEWPDYVAYRDRRGEYHSFYVRTCTNRYTRWKKDKNYQPDDDIIIVWDGQEFLTYFTSHEHQYGKKVYPVEDHILVFDLFDRYPEGKIGNTTLTEVVKNGSYQEWI